MNTKKAYQKLFVWEKSDELALKVYRFTKDFPKEEMYGLTSQIRRAVLSIPTNIAEGAGRHGQKELKHFINIALGSFYEVEYLLSFSSRLGYLRQDCYQEIDLLMKEVGMLLWRFHQSIKI